MDARPPQIPASRAHDFFRTRSHFGRSIDCPAAGVSAATGSAGSASAIRRDDPGAKGLAHPKIAKATAAFCRLTLARSIPHLRQSKSSCFFPLRSSSRPAHALIGTARRLRRPFAAPEICIASRFSANRAPRIREAPLSPGHEDQFRLAQPNCLSSARMLPSPRSLTPTRPSSDRASSKRPGRYHLAPFGWFAKTESFPLFHSYPREPLPSRSVSALRLDLYDW